MRTSRAIFTRFLCLVVVSSCLLQSNANAQGKGMATVGKLMGGALIGVGTFNLVKDIGTCAATPPVNCWKIPVDLLEIGGGAFAMMNNSETESQLDNPGFRSSSSSSSSSGGPGDGPGGDDDTIDKICAEMPANCPRDPETNRPNLVLPSKETIRDAFKKNWGAVASPDGKTLDEALAEVDANYDKAAEAVAAFNSASDSGAFDGAGSGSELAGLGDEGGEGETGVELNRGLASTTAPDGSEMLSFAGEAPMNMESFLNKLKKDRPAPIAAKAVGLNLENRDGSVLSLFERVTRAIRGTRDRDILLAKVEWSRKEAAKKLAKANTPVKQKKAPHIAVSTEKN